MCKFCKTCGKSNFGATRIRKISDAVRLVNGIVEEVFDDSEETLPEEYEINYCFECNKEITENDLVSEIKCPVCGKMVDNLTDEGICEECAEEASKLANMSKEEIVLMYLKQQKEGAAGGKKKTSKKKTSSKPKNDVKNDEEPKKDDIINKADKIVANSKVELDSKKTDDKEKKKLSNEPAEVKEEEVEQAKNNQIENLKDVPPAESVSPEKVEEVQEKDVKETIENAVPQNNNADIPSIEVEQVDNTISPIDEINELLNAIHIESSDVEKKEEHVNRDLF